MPLNEHEKSEARDAIALALELNEPETIIEGLKRLCVHKGIDAHLSDNERVRYRACAVALDHVLSELKSADKPQARDNDAPAAQEPQAEQSAPNQTDC